jgi:biopolymer transport protein ExbD
MRKTEIALSITKDLKYYLNNKELTLDVLEKELATSVQAVKDPTVVIRCDNSIPVQNLVDVMQIGSKLKIKMILATKSPNG